MTTTLAAIGDFNGLAVAIFAVVLATTLVITWWAAKRNRSATDFYTAGRGVAGAFNGIATAGDYLSASTFLGYAGLMYLFGFDGWIIGLGAMLSFLPVLYLLADRMRNAGKFTVADVLSYRLRRRPVRIAVGHQRAAHLRHLPHRPAGRRGLADRGPGRDQLHAGRPHLRDLHGRLRRLRRHARHDVGADHQGRHADDRRRRSSASPCWRSSTSARPSCSTRRRPSIPRARRSSAPAPT